MISNCFSSESDVLYSVFKYIARENHDSLVNICIQRVKAIFKPAILALSVGQHMLATDDLCIRGGSRSWIADKDSE